MFMYTCSGETVCGGKGHLGFDAGLEGLAGHAGGALHVLIAAVGAGADETRLQLGGPLVVLQCASELQPAGGGKSASWTSH